MLQVDAPTRPAPTARAPARTGGGLLPELAVGAVALAAMAATTARILTPDTYLDLYAGRWIAGHGLPHTDPLTAAGAGRTWIDQQWLAHLGTYELWVAGGYAAIGIAAALAFALAMALTVRLGRQLGGSATAAVVCTLPCAALVLTHTQLWAEALAIPLLPALALCLRPGAGTRSAAGAAAIVALWANVHGSVLLGAACLAAWGVVEVVRQPGAWPGRVAIAGALAAPFASPYGLDLITYYRSVLHNPEIPRYVAVWKRADPSGFFTQEYLVLLAVAGVVLAAAWRRGWRPDWVVAALAAGLTVAGFAAIRYQVWLPLLLGPLAASALTHAGWDRPRFSARGAAVLTGATVAAALLLVVLLLRTSTAQFESSTPRASVRATAAYLRSHPQATVMVDFSVAGAVLWLDPAARGRVAFDTRLEIYRRPDLDAWLRFNTGVPGWAPTARRYAAVVATTRFHRRTVGEITGSRSWRVVARTADGVLAVPSR